MRQLELPLILKLNYSLYLHIIIPCGSSIMEQCSQVPIRKTKLRVWVLDKVNLELEMPLILSFFVKIITGNPPRRVPVCSIIDEWHDMKVYETLDCTCLFSGTLILVRKRWSAKRWKLNESPWIFGVATRINVSLVHWAPK